MILVFGGTTEGKKTAALLENKAQPFLYSTKTKIDFKKGQFGQYRYGVLDVNSLKELILDLNITTIIYASLPFAKKLTETIHQLCKELQVPVWYIQREYEKRSGNALVHYVKSYHEAIGVLESLKIKRLLALTGVQSINRMSVFWKKTTTYFRILDRDSSLAMAIESGIDEKYLIKSFPSSTVEEESRVIDEYQCEAILTKESGKSGYLDVKVNTAIHKNIPIVIIEKPIVPLLFNVVTDVNEIEVKLKKMEQV